jgi:hypothetical protein
MATRRPDLEALPYKAPPYLATILMPYINLPGKAGTIYYKDIQSDQSAQTGRSAANAPTTTTLTSSSAAISCAEAVYRVNFADDEVNVMGGLANAQAAGSRVVKRSVGANVEALVAAHVLNGSSVPVWDIQESLIKYVALAYETLQDYAEGPIALVGARRMINRVKRYSEVIARMAYTGVIPRDIRDVRNISDEQLAAALGVDRVLAGPTAQWYTASATYQDRLAVMVLPNSDAGPLEELQFGRTYIYPIDDQGNNIMVETYRDDNLIAEVVQARVWRDAELLNPELCVILDGCDELNANTTTTTTTT